MTERDLKTMYDKMSLSEERLSELEKRLENCFENEPQDFRDFDGDELMQFDREYKPEPRRRRPFITAIVSTAAAAVIVTGAAVAFRTGLIPTGDTIPDTSSDDPVITVPVPEKHGITSQDLPEYPHMGLLDSEFLKLDSEAYDDTCSANVLNRSISESVLIAEMTFTECNYEWGSGDTVYTVTVDKSYFNLMGIQAEGLSLQLLMPGRLGYQYAGCPLYTNGDRILAALRTGENFYELSAAHTLADIITVNGKDYAAAHSRNLPVLKNYAAEDVLTYPRTVTDNPAKYYGLYNAVEFGEYYAGLAENSEKPQTAQEGDIDVTFLSFYADKQALTTIFEQNFMGNWVIDEYSNDENIDNDISLCYNVKPGIDDIFRPLNGINCGGFSMDGKGFYMLDYTDGEKLWCIMKNEPGKLYRYDGFNVHDRSDYTASYHRRAYSGVTEVVVPGRVGTMGLLKVLSDYDGSIEVRTFEKQPKFDDPNRKGTLTGAVMDVLENGLADYAGKTWKRVSLSKSEYNRLCIPEEENRVLEKTDNRLSITLRLFAADEEWRDLPIGAVYHGEICRYFRADFEKQENGEWICSDFRPLSGDTSDPDTFFSPLEDTDMYPSYMNSGEIHPEISVEYYTVENNGLVDVYAIRRLKGVFDGVTEYDLYYRDPRTDVYTQLRYGSAMGFSVDDNGTVLAAIIDEGQPFVTLFKGGHAKEMIRIDGKALSGSIDLITRGDFLLVGFDGESGRQWAVLDRTYLYEYGIYRQDELNITESGFEVRDPQSGEFAEMEVDDIMSIQAVESRARSLWSDYIVGSPMGTGNYIRFPNDRYGKVIADEDLRTREGLYGLFASVFIPETAEDALDNQVIGHSVFEEDGVMYTTEGERGGDITIYDVSFAVPEETLTETTAVLDYTITYTDFITEGPGEQEHYTINAVKTADGWRLDRFYYPY